MKTDKQINEEQQANKQNKQTMASKTRGRRREVDRMCQGRVSLFRGRVLFSFLLPVLVFVLIQLEAFNCAPSESHSIQNRSRPSRAGIINSQTASSEQNAFPAHNQHYNLHNHQSHFQQQPQNRISNGRNNYHQNNQHYHHHQQQQQQQQHQYHQQPTTVISSGHQMQHQQQQHHHHNHQFGNSAFPPSRGPSGRSTVGEHTAQLCQLPPTLASRSNCELRHEPDFRRTASAEFQKLLEQSSQDLRLLLGSYSDELRLHTRDLLSSARNSTLSRLVQNRPANSGANQEDLTRVTERLFGSLQIYLDQAGAQLADSADVQAQWRSLASLSDEDLGHEIAAFFHKLHVLQAKRLLDAKLQPREQANFECLAANLPDQKSIEAFLVDLGQANYTARLPDQETTRLLAAERQQLVSAIKSSAEFAKTLASSLAQFREMLNGLAARASEWTAGASCQRALVRLSVCPQCYPLDSAPSRAAPPCESYCLNVVRGCMNDLYELDRFWSETVTALGQFRSNMLLSNNLESVLLSLDEKLDKFNARLTRQLAPNSHQNGQLNLLHKTQIAKIEGLCVKPSGSVRASLPTRILMLPQANFAGPAGFNESRLSRLQQPEHSLFNRLDGFVHDLENVRDFFATWPERVCTRVGRSAGPEGPHSTSNQNPVAALKRSNSSEDQHCWNGRDFTGYKKQLVAFGQPITSSHPEVPVSQSEPLNGLVLTYVAKLKEVKAQLAQKAGRSPQVASLAQTVELLQAAPDTLAALAQSLTLANETNTRHLSSADHSGGSDSELERADDEELQTQNNPLALERESNDEALEETAEDDDDEPPVDFDCKTNDCLDLFDELTTQPPQVADWQPASGNQQQVEDSQQRQLHQAGNELPLPAAKFPNIQQIGLQNSLDQTASIEHNFLLAELSSRNERIRQQAAGSSSSRGQRVFEPLSQLLSACLALLLVLVQFDVRRANLLLR